MNKSEHKYVEPIIWDNYNMNALNNLDKMSVHDSRKFSKLLFLCFTVIYNTSDYARYPMHILITELILNTESSRDQLLDELCKLGITVCATTHKRFEQSLVKYIEEHGGLAKDLKSLLLQSGQQIILIKYLLLHVLEKMANAPAGMVPQ